jgi:type I restriction enzyme S subunit
MIIHPHRSILGPIPDDWDTIPLRRCLVHHAAGDWGDEHGEVTLSVLRSTNFTDSRELDLGDVALRGFSKKDADKFTLLAGDILLERSGGGPGQPVGRVVRLDRDLPGSAFSNFVQLLRVDKEVLNPDYVAWCLYGLHASGIVERLQHQTTQMRNLDFRDYVRVHLPRPSPEEQQWIADSIWLVDDSIRSATTELEKARRLKTALLQQLFTRGQPGRHQRFKQTKLGEVPEEWEILELKKCGKWGSGGTPDRANKAFWNGTIPWVKSGEVDYHLIEDSEEKITDAGAASVNGELLPVGSLLVAMYGAGITRGKAALLATRAYVNQAIAFFQGDGRTDNEWLLYWFERNYERVRAFAGGSNQDNLSLYLLKNVQMARPVPPEQAEIINLLKSASGTLVAIDGKIEALKRLKCSLLQNLLTGRTRLRVEEHKKAKTETLSHETVGPAE